jgi:hypothetical protein
LKAAGVLNKYRVFPINTPISFPQRDMSSFPSKATCIVTGKSFYCICIVMYLGLSSYWGGGIDRLLNTHYITYSGCIRMVHTRDSHDAQEDSVLFHITCQRCGHTWVPRQEDVRICPNKKCRSIYFDRPRTHPKRVYIPRRM